MQGEVLENLNLLLGAALSSLIHTLLPSHWLPITLIARSNKWTLSKTLVITTMAGLFHILSAIALGLLVTVIGRQFLVNVNMNMASSAILIVFGVIYIILHMAGRHYHHHHEISENATAGGLVLAMILSPCEAIAITFIPVAFIGGKALVIMMSGVLMIVTIGSLLMVVTLSFHGLRKLQFKFIDQYEKLIIGIILCLVGVSIQLLHPVF